MMVSSRDLQAASRNCVQYLLNNIRGDGSFVYERDAKTGSFSPKYNILRHAGSLYVLYQSLALTQQEHSAPLLEKGIAYLINYLRPLQTTGDTFCIVEDKEAKLGGTALALLAIIGYYRTQPDKEILEAMKKMASFLVWMQEPSGKFRSKLMYEGKYFSTFESTYYPGEAILALTAFYRIDPDTKWLDAAESGAGYLVKNPVTNDMFHRGHNHWFAIALSELYSVCPRKKYYKELWQIVESTALAARYNLWDMQQPVPATAPFTSASMATYGEALVAALQLELRLGKRQRVADLVTVLHEILDYCLSFQITGDAAAPLTASGAAPSIAGGITMSKTNSRIRIDYVQHVLSVIIGMLKADV